MKTLVGEDLALLKYAAKANKDRRLTRDSCRRGLPGGNGPEAAPKRVKAVMRSGKYCHIVVSQGIGIVGGCRYN